MPNPEPQAAGQGPMDAVEDAQADAGAAPAAGTGDELADLAHALEAAGALPVERRLELLQQAERSIATALEGLDGL